MQDNRDKAARKVADLFDIRNRFLRSVQLERDFNDSDVSSSYIPTDFTRSCFTRIVEGLKHESAQRAWRITGDYGSGKSSFALSLAHSFSGLDSYFTPQVNKIADLQNYRVSKLHFVPVLVTCTRQSLGKSILKSLYWSLGKINQRRIKVESITKVQRLLTSNDEPSDDQIVELVLHVTSQITENSKEKGLLLILDELGKFLEFAALNPQRNDLFLLQRLAEIASRSGNNPIFIVCLLHQGFQAYAESLSQSEQREWEKVAGRFEEIVFDQPVEQVINLIASAINVRSNLIPKTIVPNLIQSMKQTIALRWFGPASSEKLIESVSSIFPIHPTVLPVLIRIFKRFGQNERSLFSFLLSNEPFGLQAFAVKDLKDSDLYRLHNLYDYVRTNFGHRLSTLSYRSHWNLIDSVIESFSTENELQISILKTIGILNLLNDYDLIATEESINCVFSGNPDIKPKQIRDTLQKLVQGKRVLYNRGQARGLCLWPHTSVDLEKSLDDARRAVDSSQRVSGFIADYLTTRPIVARRHYIETGNLRHYDVIYRSINDLQGLLENDVTDADGLVIVPLCETASERQIALEFSRRPELKILPNWLIAIPQPLSCLSALVQEVQRWEWVATNTLDLNADKYAREEVSRQREAAQLQLEKRIKSLIGFNQQGERITLKWFHCASPLKINDARHLLEELSRIFDETYAKSPRIYNELVNRRSLSSAAAAARMRLIEQMFTHPREPFLGLDSTKKPPEMSMYLSVLKQTGLHQQHGESWQISEPPQKKDNGFVLPSFQRILEIIQNESDSRVFIADLFEQLRKPPYGVRDGLIPILLTVFAIAHEQEIAFYKEGTFQSEMNAETMLLLTKAPEKFEIQFCKIEGVRAKLFEKLLTVLEFKRSSHRKAELLDIVRPLCTFVAQLPNYVLNTKELSPSSLAVRDTVLNAREPVKLLFSDLPKASGFKPFLKGNPNGNQIHLFVKTLKILLDELKIAYPELLERIKKRLRESFELPGSFQQFRTALAQRAEQIVLGINEPKLKPFCLRLMDDSLPETEWLESIGSLIALKPPSKWRDAEENLFNQQLIQLASNFRHVESIVFGESKPSKNSTGIRLSITKPSGVEHEQVIHYTKNEEYELKELQHKFETLLAKNKRLSLVAASNALWETMKQGERKASG